MGVLTFGVLSTGDCDLLVDGEERGGEKQEIWGLRGDHTFA